MGRAGTIAAFCVGVMFSSAGTTGRRWGAAYVMSRSAVAAERRWGAAYVMSRSAVGMGSGVCHVKECGRDVEEMGTWCDVEFLRDVEEMGS